jgi:lysophospholipase L1-like esterase
MVQASTVGDRLDFTPGGTFNEIEVTYFAGTSVGQGSFQISVDAGATNLLTVDCTIPAEGMAVAKIACAGTSTVASIKLASGTMYLQGVATRNTLRPGVEIYNGGASGGRLLEFSSARVGGTVTTYAVPTEVVKALVADSPTTPHVVYINGWGNDFLSDAATSATCITYLTTLVNALRALSPNVDVIYESYQGLGNASIALATQASYEAAIIDAMVRLNVPVVDVGQVIRAQAAWNTAGYFFDDLHLNANGHAFRAQNIYVTMFKALQKGVF